MSNSSGSSTFRVSPYAPANETEADLVFERLNLNGAILGAVAYGVHITLFFLCLSLLLKLKKKEPRNSWILIGYITFNLILGTIGNAGGLRFNQLTFIDDRDYPGGPNGFFVAQNSLLINVISYSFYIVNTWSQDGLLLYRFWLIWGFKYWVAAIPTMLYIVSVIMSCLLIAQLSKSNETIFGHVSVNFALTYWSVSIATTILITTLIVGRLLYMRYRLRKVIGPNYNSPYVSISAMFVESASLYSIVALIFIVTFARNDPVQNLFLPLLGQVQSISPLLIILRVSQGRAWSKDTGNEETYVKSAGSLPRSLRQSSNLKTSNTAYELAQLPPKIMPSSSMQKFNTEPTGPNQITMLEVK